MNNNSHAAFMCNRKVGNCGVWLNVVDFSFDSTLWPYSRAVLNCSTISAFFYKKKTCFPLSAGVHTRTLLFVCFCFFLDVQLHQFSDRWFYLLLCGCWFFLDSDVGVKGVLCFDRGVNARGVAAVAACHGDSEGVCVLQFHFVLFWHFDKGTAGESLTETGTKPAKKKGTIGVIIILTSENVCLFLF